MNKKEVMKLFEKNVAYLHRNIPPDDVYIFAEQTFMAALYFLHRWSDYADIEKECKENEITRKWVANILGFQKMKDQDIDVDLDLKLDSLDEDN